MSMNMYVYRVTAKSEFWTQRRAGRTFRSVQLERGKAHLNAAAKG